MKAIVLAAGYATRLHPLTENQPKPLLDVGGKPIIERIVDKIQEIEEVDKIFVVTNDKFHPMLRAWAMEHQAKKKIKVINDGTFKNDDRLGAVGDLNFVVQEEGIDDDILMIAGDNLFGFDLTNFLSFFKEKRSSVLAFCDLKDKEKISNKFGVGILSEEKKIIDFEEKPAEPRSTLAATCCYVFSKKDVKEVANFVRVSRKWDNPGDFAKWLAKRNDFHGFVFDEHWFDIGSFEGLEEANKFYKK
jgi:glucose-1-phosphate thymidylyltransferase